MLCSICPSHSMFRTASNVEDRSPSEVDEMESEPATMSAEVNEDAELREPMIITPTNTEKNTAYKTSQSSRKRVRQLVQDPAEDQLATSIQGMVKILSDRKQQNMADLSANELFGRSVGKALESMTPRQCALAKLRIQEVLVDVEFGNIGRECEPCGINDYEHTQSQATSQAIGEAYRSFDFTNDY